MHASIAITVLILPRIFIVLDKHQTSLGIPSRPVPSVVLKSEELENFMCDGQGIGESEMVKVRFTVGYR